MDLLVIITLVFIWCGLVPVAGAFMIRHSWRVFRHRFDSLCLQPVLDYAACQNTPAQGAVYRFIGGFESLTDGRTLWIRSDTLTIPIALDGAHTYMLPLPEGGNALGPFDPGEEFPERIRWDRISTLTEGAKVFVGGLLFPLENRWTFVSTRENPLLVIFYDGPDNTLAARAIRAGRHKNEYLNPITPYGFMFNAFSQILMALAFLPRPAFRLTALTALIALFAPIFPFLPPGVLLTVLYRRLWWQARIFRAYRDLVRLPLKYLPCREAGSAPSREEERRLPKKSPPERTLLLQGRLPNGESYGVVYCERLPEGSPESSIPLLVPNRQPRRGAGWYVFGAVPGEGQPSEQDGPGMGKASPPLPVRPQDPCAAFGAIPGEPEKLARGYTLSAYTLEMTGGLFLMIGIGLNILFISMIIYLLQ
jgi:hypothetical protein